MTTGLGLVPCGAKVFAALAVFAALTACGGTGPSKYTTDARAEAAQRMDQIKSATEWDMARQRFEAGDLEKALEAVDRSLALNAEVATSHVLRGRIMLEMGRTQSAMRSFDTALALAPKNGEAHFYRSVVLERIGRPEEALEGYKAAAEIDPESTQYLLAATEMLVQMDRLSEAEAYLADAMEFHQYDAGIHQTLAHIARMRGDNAAALRHIEEAAVLAPDDPVIIEDLALAEIAAGQHAQAETRLARLISTLEADGKPVRRDLRHLRARCLIEQERLIEARRELQTLASGAEGETDLPAWMSLGAIALRTGDAVGLRNAGERIVEIAPQAPDGYYYLGLWRHASDDPSGAIPWLDEAVARSAASATPSTGPLIARALAWLDLGRREEAERDARAAQQLDPMSREASAVLVALGAAAPR